MKPFILNFPMNEITLRNQNISFTVLSNQGTQIIPDYFPSVIRKAVGNLCFKPVCKITGSLEKSLNLLGLSTQD